jgi:hypothetical protein
MILYKKNQPIIEEVLKGKIPKLDYGMKYSDLIRVRSSGEIVLTFSGGRNEATMTMKVVEGGLCIVRSIGSYGWSPVDATHEQRAPYVASSNTGILGYRSYRFDLFPLVPDWEALDDQDRLVELLSIYLVNYQAYQKALGKEAAAQADFYKDIPVYARD